MKFLKAFHGSKRLTQPKRKKRTMRERMVLLLGTIIALFSIMMIATHRGIIYLSDLTYPTVRFPLLFIVLMVLAVTVSWWMWVKKKTKKRIFLSGLSSIALVVLLINTTIFSMNSGKNAPVISVAAEGTKSVADGHSFMAGAAKGDITPPDYMMPMPLLSVLKFDEVTHPVYSRVLAVSDGQQEALYVTLDMTLVPEADETINYLHENTGVAKENIFISATHTHGTTPISLMDYKGIDGMKVQQWYEQVKETILQTSKAALENMVPARYGYGTGESEVNVNRDLDGEKSVLGSNFDRPSDKTIHVVRFESLTGDPIGLIVNYNVHSVVMNGALHAGLRTYWSDDLAGNTARKIENQLDGSVVLYSIGAAGDQNPVLTAQYGGPKGGQNPAASNLGRVSFNALEYLSEVHSRDILRANEKVVATRVDGTIEGAHSVAQAKSVDEGESVDYNLSVLRIGDLTFQGVGAEIVHSVGEALVETSPDDQTILVGLVNGYEGYVADDWEYDHDAFEAGNAKTPKGEGEKALVQGFRELFSEMEK